MDFLPFRYKWCQEGHADMMVKESGLKVQVLQGSSLAIVLANQVFTRVSKQFLNGPCFVPWSYSNRNGPCTKDTRTQFYTMQTYGVAFRFRFVLTKLTRKVKPVN